MSRCCASDKPRKKTSKTVAVLISCCLFLLIICVCLITVLVFVGKHILYNHPSVYYVTRKIVPVNSLPVPERSYKRLPNDTKPILYDLTLLPDLTTGEYKGFVNMTVNITAFRKDIIVHSKNLSVAEIAITTRNSKVLQVLSIDENLIDEVLIITTREKITPGIYYLFIKFEGSLKDKLTGFYRSQYRQSTGQQR